MFNFPVYFYSEHNISVYSYGNSLIREHTYVCVCVLDIFRCKGAQSKMSGDHRSEHQILRNTSGEQAVWGLLPGGQGKARQFLKLSGYQQAILFGGKKGF